MTEEDDFVEKEFDRIQRALSNQDSPAQNLLEIGQTHLDCEEQCAICEYAEEMRANILDNVAGHINCPDELLDKICYWAFDRGTYRIIDVLLQAVKRPNLPQSWLDYVLDLPWRYQVQFEPDVVYHFIRNINKGRELTVEEKSRIVLANDLEEFPSDEILKAKGFF